MKDENRGKGHEDHPIPASNAVSLDPAFLLTFLTLTLPQTDSAPCTLTSYCLGDGCVTGIHFTEIVFPTHYWLQTSFPTFMHDQAKQIENHPLTSVVLNVEWKVEHQGLNWY